MNEAAQKTDANGDEAKKPRFRSPAYPAIPLAKSIERVSELHEKALHHQVPISVLASAWEYGAKSSGLFGTVAALKQFGLLLDEGSGEKRRFRLTDWAIRIVRDPDPQSDKRRETIKHAAIHPKIHRELWEKYGVAGASGSMDVALKGYLTLDRAEDGESAFSGKAADELIEEYKATIAFAGLSSSGNISPDQHQMEDSGNLLEPRENDEKKQLGGAKVGDLIQREANGVFTFEKPLRVRAIRAHEGQDWVFVEGSETGIPMNEVIVEEKVEAPILPIEEDKKQLREGWHEERLIDDDGDEIFIRYEGEPSTTRYEFIRDYLSFKIARLNKRRDQATKPTD